jgi:hypothetical protein
VEHGGTLQTFRLVDLSYGGVGVLGASSGLRVGSLVRVMLTLANGNRLTTCPVLDQRAVVKRVGAAGIGLAWCPTAPERAGEIAHIVDDAIRFARV